MCNEILIQVITMRYQFRVNTEKLNELINDSGIKRKKIIEWLDVTIPRFYRWMNGETEIPLTAAASIAKMINCSVYDFLEEVEGD